MMGSLLEYLFGCGHKNLSRPMTPVHVGAGSSTYVVCLDCGKRFAYDWKAMRIGRSLEYAPVVGQAGSKALAAQSAKSV
jgi:hypothetical protein